MGYKNVGSHSYFFAAHLFGIAPVDGYPSYSAAPKSPPECDSNLAVKSAFCSCGRCEGESHFSGFFLGVTNGGGLHTVGAGRYLMSNGEGDKITGAVLRGKGSAPVKYFRFSVLILLIKRLDFRCLLKAIGW